MIAATCGAPIATQTLREAGVPAPREAESLAVLTASFDGRPGLLACGADSRGLTYALLELADRIRCGERPESALTLRTPLLERPHNRVRSIGRLFVSDVEDKPWFHDREFWPAYLSMLAAERFNRFQLSLGIGGGCSTTRRPARRSAANDTYMPELYTNQPIVDAGLPSPYGDTPSPKFFGYVSPLDPQMFSSIEESVGELLEGRRSGRTSPCEVARWLDALAGSAERQLAQALKADATPPDAELRRVVVDVRISSGLGRFFAAKLRSGALHALYRRTSDVAPLQEAVREYQAARAIWAQFAEYARGVYVPDITIGPLPHQRGHWLDRLPAMDADIAAMRRELASARARHRSAAAEQAPIPGLLSPDRGPSPALRHRAPQHFVPGKPLILTIEAGHDTPVLAARLFYRHVDQAEEYTSVELTQHEGEFQAVIPAAYTGSEYALQYFFEARDARDRPHLVPGFTSDLGNQPYYVVPATHASPT